jgi:hypothetical protein
LILWIEEHQMKSPSFTLFTHLAARIGVADQETKTL